MIYDILRHTPVWIFFLFTFLIIVGWIQTKPRNINLSRLLIIPTVMILLSIIGVLASFGMNIMSMAFWLTGVVAAITLHWIFKYPGQVTYNKDTKIFSIPGSWIPLALMMLIFFTKYFIGASIAIHPEIKTISSFIIISCLILGFASGSFFSRAFFIVNKFLIRTR